MDYLESCWEADALQIAMHCNALLLFQQMKYHSFYPQWVFICWESDALQCIAALLLLVQQMKYLSFYPQWIFICWESDASVQ